MMKRKYQINFRLAGFAMLVCLSWLSACIGNKQTTGSSSGCEHQATIRDFSNLDGCKFLFELKNGDLLLPGEWKTDQPAEMTDGQQVRISYEVMEGMASICMREKYIVRMTCFERADE